MLTALIDFEIIDKPSGSRRNRLSPNEHTFFRPVEPTHAIFSEIIESRVNEETCLDNASRVFQHVLECRVVMCMGRNKSGLEYLWFPRIFSSNSISVVNFDVCLER